MNLGGTLVNTVVRLVILFATLALVYLFIIKPVLHTTEVGINSATNFSNQITQSIDVANDASYKNAMKQMNEALKQANSQSGTTRVVVTQNGKTNVKASDQQRLLRCVQNSNRNVNRLVRCNEKFGP
jgi:archaellum component FlaF (FlaF/FlaG flagellin family)